MCFANAQDLNHNAGIRLCGIAQLSPVRPPASLNDVVNGDGGELFRVDVPVFHVMKLGNYSAENKQKPTSGDDCQGLCFGPFGDGYDGAPPELELRLCSLSFTVEGRASSRPQSENGPKQDPGVDA